jgi:FixJ family two-component response regulator
LASRLASRDVQKGLTGKPEFRLNPAFSKVAQRRSNKEIAAELVISERAARSHREHVLFKLDRRSRTQAALWAVSVAIWSATASNGR